MRTWSRCCATPAPSEPPLPTCICVICKQMAGAAMQLLAAIQPYAYIQDVCSSCRSYDHHASDPLLKLRWAQPSICQEKYAGGLLTFASVRCDRLGMNGLDAASQLCTLVFTCDLPLLRRFITAGVPVDAGDYDERTALHISACESNFAVVRC